MVVYNPILGRFLSADPSIQFAKVQQSYNRYSYVHNNPLKYTDPTGYTLEWMQDFFSDLFKSRENSSHQMQEENQRKENLERGKTKMDAGAITATAGVSAGGTVNNGSNSVSNFLENAWNRSFGPDEKRLEFLIKDGCYSGCSNQPLSDDQRAMLEATQELTGALGVAAPGEVIMAARALGMSARASAKDAVKQVDVGKGVEGGVKAGGDFYRGAKPGVAPNFIPRSNDFKVDKMTGLVKENHGVSVFDNVKDVTKNGYVPHAVDKNSIPDSLRIIQRGQNPGHYEIVPNPGSNLTPQQFIDACSGIGCTK